MPETTRLETMHQSLLDREIIVSADRARQLREQGYKVALIGFEKGGNFLVRFNQDSITSFFNQVNKYSGFREISMRKTYFAEYPFLFLDQPVFMTTREERELPSMLDALKILNNAPWMERTSSFVVSKTTGKK